MLGVFVLICKSSMYISSRGFLLYMFITNILSHFVGHLLTLQNVFFVKGEFLVLTYSAKKLLAPLFFV